MFKNFKTLDWIIFAAMWIGLVLAWVCFKHAHALSAWFGLVFGAGLGWTACKFYGGTNEPNVTLPKITLPKV
jgi:multisubunit Na+/H+ antiporter MnhE subunit